MNPPDFDAIFDELEPEQYRDFRVLHNELIGYIERNEVDKIIEFSKRIEYHVALSLELKRSLQQTMQHQIKQRANIKKQHLRANATIQTSNIVVTHPFPSNHLNQSVSDELVSPTPHDEAVTINESTDKIDEVLARMRSHTHGVDTVLSDDVAPDHVVQHAVNESPESSEESMTMAMPDPDHVVAEAGYVSRDAQVQENLAIQSSNKTSNKKTASKSKQATVSNDAAKIDAYKRRRARIQSYIDQHQSKGTITHEQ